MSMQHTPGPWHRNIKPASRYPVIFAGRNTHVAMLLKSDVTLEELEANADLIAAAPSMLAALQAISRGYGVTFQDAAVRDLAQQAIAKAPARFKQAKKEASDIGSRTYTHQRCGFKLRIPLHLLQHGKGTSLLQIGAVKLKLHHSSRSILGDVPKSWLVDLNADAAATHAFDDGN